MLDVLYEDNHLLAVNKPAMLPTMGVAADRPSLLAEAKAYIRRKYTKPGEVYLGIVSRLDAPVTGVVLIARTSKAAARLSKLFRERDVDKSYLAIVEGQMEPASGQLVHFLRKDERHRRMHVTGENTPGAQRAELSYRLRREATQASRSAGNADHSVAAGIEAGRCPPYTLVEVELLTGRKHQIRVQLAAARCPIVGDRKYGARQTFPSGIALHARRLAFEHPVRNTPVEIAAPLPPAWNRWIDSPMIQ